MGVIGLTVVFPDVASLGRATMFAIARGFFKDWREARKNGESII